MTSYYNENDPFAAQWLRNLISAGLIAPGEVDDRSILDVRAADLAGFTQCHFFAGLGGWPRALQLAGWPVGREVWTGSCPCQPLSVAGRQQGHADQRHLWPAFFRLIAERGPAVVLGEQVASKDGREWLAAVRTDLEHLGYAFGGADLPAAGVGAPHRRQRLWFVADADSGNRREEPGIIGGKRFAQSGADVADADVHLGQQRRPGDAEKEPAWRQSERGGVGEAVADADRGRRQGLGVEEYTGIEGASRHQPDRRGAPGRRNGTDAADPGEPRLPAPEREVLPGTGRRHEGRATPQCDWWRVEPDVGRVAHGVPGRVGKLRALGNAIVPQVAAQFIGAYLDVIQPAQVAA